LTKTHSEQLHQKFRIEIPDEWCQGRYGMNCLAVVKAKKHQKHFSRSSTSEKLESTFSMVGLDALIFEIMELSPL
jgi:hypothetical protein